MASKTPGAVITPLLARKRAILPENLELASQRDGVPETQAKPNVDLISVEDLRHPLQRSRAEHLVREALRGGHTRLDWRRPHQALARGRHVGWTWSCRGTAHERCEGGGQAFLRRTVQLDGTPEVRKTSPCSIHEAGAIWTALLSGQAR